MDSSTFKLTMQKWFLGEGLCEETRLVILTHSEQFQKETEELLLEGLRTKTILFEKANQLNCSPQLIEVLIQAAAKEEHWDFLFDALGDTDGINAVFSHMSNNPKDSSSFVDELCDECNKNEMQRFISLVAERAMFDYLKEVVVAVGTFEVQPSLDSITAYRTVYSLVYRNLIDGCTRDTLVNIFNVVFLDARYHCQYLAILLAARLNKWKWARKALKSGRVRLLKGSDEIFARAMNRGAWGCAAQLLQNVMGVKDITETNYLLDIQYKAEMRVMRKARFRVVAFVPFVRQCMQQKLFAAGALFAAWERSWKTVQSFLNRMKLGEADNANTIVLEEVMRNRRFRLVYNWLTCPYQRELRPVYVDSVLWEASVNCRNPGAHALVQQLMDKTEDSALLGQVLYHIILYCQLDLLHLFLAKGLLQRTDDVEFALQGAVDMFGSTWSQTDHLKDYPRYRILLSCFEAGCSVQLPAGDPTKVAMDVAVKHGLMQVIHLLYYTGATSAADLRRISLGLDDGSSEPRENDSEVRSYFQHVVDSARSLENLCCIKLSGLIGCGADRKQRALALGLPLTLTRKILFLDVLYPEEEEEEGEEEEEEEYIYVTDQ